MLYYIQIVYLQRHGKILTKIVITIVILVSVL